MNPKSLRTPAAMLILMAGFVLGQASQPTPLAPKHKAWIEDDVDMLVTPLEREAFLNLESDQSRDRFIEEFWLQRDPTPGTPRNEIRSEHFRRMEFADRVFGGWRGKGGRGFRARPRLRPPGLAARSAEDRRARARLDRGLDLPEQPGPRRGRPRPAALRRAEAGRRVQAL